MTKKHNIGVMISQKDSNGDFKPLGVKEKRNRFNPEIEEFEPETPCNL